jgi:hypothetical protein
MTRNLCVLLAVVATACGSTEPPNCETAIRNAAKQVVGSDQPGEDEIAAMVSTCISQKWTGAVRSCLGGARTSEQSVSCISGREVKPGEMSPSKRSEAELNLNVIAKSNKLEFAENASFARGSVGLTPAKPCCEYPGKKCTFVASDWEGTGGATTVWDVLDFEMSKPFLFQYSYESDGNTYEARAVGDLDCDGTTVTYVMRGSAVNGNPHHELTKPSNAD